MKTNRELQKTQSRKKIIETAITLFKKNGYAATGIDAVMQGAGLTAGGFYNHFQSKDDLLAKCLFFGFKNSKKILLDGVQKTSNSQSSKHAGISKIWQRYLSTQHRDQPSMGCPLVGIAAELSRGSKATSKITAEYISEWITTLAEFGLTRAEAIQNISTAVGALLISRIVRGDDLSDEFLNSTKLKLSEN